MSGIRAAALAALLLPGAVQGQELPVVKLFTTGGTIQSLGKDRLKLAEYREGRIDGATIVEAVPEASRLARIEVEAISAVSSTRMGAEQGLPLARQLMTELERPEVAGAVVTHGTTTLEETAYFLHLTVRTTKPIVVIGSMRPWTAVSRDGPLNFLGAVRTVLTPEAAGKGVLVLLNDTIHSARFVTKRHTYHIETFVSPDVGPLGFADADRVVLYRSPVTRHTADTEFDLDGIEELPQVDVVYGYQEASRAPIDALVEEGAKGIILADGSPAYGNAVLEARAAGVVVVQGSRKGSGRVVLSDRTAARGEITADNLHPQKARILLRLALTRTTDARELQRIFNEY
ncbi:MAG: asparaginase [Acidobacteria bacterium]|nr:asparaginase [Acidobacteriota bacterium]